MLMVVGRISKVAAEDLDLYEVAFKIEVIEKSGEVTSPHP
jgi:phage terminase large subunit